MTESAPNYCVTPIGNIVSPYTEKFAIPRQPGLVSAAKCSVRLSDKCNREEILRGLDGFSHVWIIFMFHQSIKTDWKPMVRPPRLGGNSKIGVFASRSPFRPNPVGLSVVKLKELALRNGRWFVDFEGGDLLDGTPVIDIKPYLPYADAICEASASYAQEAPSIVEDIEFSAEAVNQLTRAASQYPDIELLIKQVLAQQPQPAYKKTSDETFGMKLYDLNIRWRQRDGRILVEEITPAGN